jgi:hypothetical protein
MGRGRAIGVRFAMCIDAVQEPAQGELAVARASWLARSSHSMAARFSLRRACSRAGHETLAQMAAGNGRDGRTVRARMPRPRSSRSTARVSRTFAFAVAHGTRQGTALLRAPSDAAPTRYRSSLRRRPRRRCTKPMRRPDRSGARQQQGAAPSLPGAADGRVTVDLAAFWLRVLEQCRAVHLQLATEGLTEAISMISNTVARHTPSVLRQRFVKYFLSPSRI